MSTEANNIFPPAEPPKAPFAPIESHPVKEPVAVVVPAPKVDHFAEIEQLVRSLHNVSPSGAETIRDQILERIGAIRDPKAWDAKVAAAKKAEDDAEAIRKKAREDAKAAAKAAKVA